MEDIILYRAGDDFKHDRYIGSITKEMDRFCKYKDITTFRTYILVYELNEKENIYVFVLPGATRGNIKTDKNNVITEINFYKDAFDVYQEAIVEHCKKFIDCRLIFKED